MMQVSIPKGWNSAKLRDVAELERDSIQPANISTGTTYVGLEHIVSDGTFLNVGSVDEGELASSKFSFGPDHLLYGKLRPYLRKIIRPDFHGVCSTDILPLKPSTRINKDYLFYYLRQPSMVELATSRCSGANLPRLSPQTLLNFPVTFPPLPEQKRIAAILDKADSIRRKRQEAVRLTEELLRSVFLDMFGDPMTNPKGWEVKKLDDLVTKLGDGLHGTPIYSDSGDYYFVNGNNLREGKIHIDSYTKRVDVVEYLKYKKELNDTTMLVSINGTIGNVALYNGENVVLGKSACYFNLKPKLINSQYLYHQINSQYFLQYAVGQATGSTIKNVSLKAMRSFPVLYPPLDLQRRFAIIIESAEKQRGRLRDQLTEIDTLFTSLLLSAFKGEL